MTILIDDIALCNTLVLMRPINLLFKMDIQNAFRILPLAVSEWDQLGFKFQGQYYVEKCMPFGCYVSCKKWELFATFFGRILSTLKVTLSTSRTVVIVISNLDYI